MGEIETAVVIPARDEEELLPYILDGLSAQRNIGQTALILVDNGSTDRTVDIFEDRRVALLEAGFQVVETISEDTPGIAKACDRGFTHAIENLGANIVARLDADTVPSSTWLASLIHRHASDGSIALLTGPVVPGLPELTLWRDRLIVPTAKFIGKILKAGRYKEIGMLKFAPGYNMSTTADAYKRVGGFQSLFGLTEDVRYNLEVAREFGAGSIRFERLMKVHNSQRRLRMLGYLGTARYYFIDSADRQSVSTT